MIKTNGPAVAPASRLVTDEPRIPTESADIVARARQDLTQLDKAIQSLEAGYEKRNSSAFASSAMGPVRAVSIVAADGSPASLKLLGDFARTADDVVARRDAGFALGADGSREGNRLASELLKSGVGDMNPKCAAANALVARLHKTEGDKEALEILTSALKDAADPSLRRYMARELGLRGKEAGVPALLANLKNTDLPTRAIAAAELGAYLHKGEVYSTFIKIAANPSFDPKCDEPRLTVLKELASIKKVPEVKNLLTRIARNSEDPLQKVAERILVDSSAPGDQG